MSNTMNVETWSTRDVVDMPYEQQAGRSSRDKTQAANTAQQRHVTTNTERNSDSRRRPSFDVLRSASNIPMQVSVNDDV